MLVVFFLILYLYSSILLFRKKVNSFLILVITFSVFHDYVFAKVSNQFHSEILFFAAKSWKEIFLLSFFLFSFLDKKYKNELFQNNILILAGLIFLISIGFMTESGNLFTQLLIARQLLSNFILLFFIYIYIRVYPFDLKLIIKFFYLLTFILVTKGLYDYYTFDGDYTKAWHYNIHFEVKKYEHIVRSTIVRNGNLRANSFFVTSIDFAHFLLIPLTFFLTKIIKRKEIIFKDIFVILILLWTISLTQTRMALLSVSIVFLFTILRGLQLNRLSKPLPYFAIIAIYSYIFLGYSDDPSILGRIPQIFRFFDSFIFFGHGFNQNFAQSFDSFYFSILSIFGAFGIFIILILKTILNRIALMSASNKTNIFILSIYAIDFSLIVIFTFHYMISASFLFIVLLFNIFILAHYEKK